jgi:two-component system response regulator BaeR
MNILIVEDELDLGSIVRDYLQKDGYSCTLVQDADTALQLIQQAAWDLVLLDIMLPSQSGFLNGLSLCQEIRKNSKLPIIIMSARIEEIDRLLGFEMGSDDYICKPFSPRELVARVRAILKRTQADLTSNTFQLHKDSLSVTFKNNKVELTIIEYRLLETLYTKQNCIVTRNELMKKAYSDHRIVSDRTMDSHITKLRKKLLPLTSVEVIHSVYGAGYKFSVNS